MHGLAAAKLAVGGELVHGQRHDFHGSHGIGRTTHELAGHAVRGRTRRAGDGVVAIGATQAGFRRPHDFGDAGRVGQVELHLFAGTNFRVGRRNIHFGRRDHRHRGITRIVAHSGARNTLVGGRFVGLHHHVVQTVGRQLSDRGRPFEFDFRVFGRLVNARAQQHLGALAYRRIGRQDAQRVRQTIDRHVQRSRTRTTRHADGSRVQGRLDRRSNGALAIGADLQAGRRRPVHL